MNIDELNLQEDIPELGKELNFNEQTAFTSQEDELPNEAIADPTQDEIDAFLSGY